VTFLATLVALAGSGLLLGVVGAFLVPLRLPGGLEGLAVVVALLGNLGLGLLGGLGLRSTFGAATPAVAWFVPVAVLFTSGPGGNVVIPGRLGGDPGVPRVGVGFLVGGVVAAIVAHIVTVRYTKASGTPTSGE
jgi:hypothetical protein